MRHYIITISKDNKVIANCRIEAANKAGAAALVTECKFAEAGYKVIVFAVKKDKTKKVCTKEQLIAAIKQNTAADKPMLPTKKDCAPAPSDGYAGNTDRSVDYKVYRVTKKQLDYLTYLLARYGDSSKTPRQLNPSEVSKSIKILRSAVYMILDVDITQLKSVKIWSRISTSRSYTRLSTVNSIVNGQDTNLPIDKLKIIYIKGD